MTGPAVRVAWYRFRATLAGGLAAGPVAALGLTLVASVRRRRRDLALLNTLGFTRRQLAAIALAAVAALVLANLVAALPGRSAARTPAAMVLRAE